MATPKTRDRATTDPVPLSRVKILNDEPSPDHPTTFNPRQIAAALALYKAAQLTDSAGSLLEESDEVITADMLHGLRLLLGAAGPELFEQERGDGSCLWSLMLGVTEMLAQRVRLATMLDDAAGDSDVTLDRSHTDAMAARYSVVVEDES